MAAARNDSMVGRPMATRPLWTFLLLVIAATASSAQEAVPDPVSLAPAPAEATDLCSTGALSTVYRCIGHDLVSVTRGDSLRWLIGGGVLAGGSLLLDDEVLQKLADEDQDPTVAIGEHLGEAGLHFGVPFAIYLAARSTGHHGAADLAIVVFRTQIVNGILTRALKLVPRPRPYQGDATVTKGSFPSGHTSATFATATVLQRRLGWRVGVPAYLVAGFVGATRLQNVHYLSDVTFGAALGIASGLALDLPGRHPVITPMLAPGVVGLSVSLIGD